MNEQNYANHRRFVKGFHMLLTLLLFAGVAVSVVNIFRHKPDEGGFISAILITLIFICLMLMGWFVRSFPMKAQDRAIRAEEGLRYFILTRKPIDGRITISQIAALRFAPDDELLPLVDRAVAENLSADDIKKAIKNWRSDTHRV